MQIRNYTSFWNLEKKVYSFYDVQLPVPVSLRVLGVFVVTGIPWWGLLSLFHTPLLVSPWYLLWIVPPAFFAWIGSKPWFEGKTLLEYLVSRFRYLMENKKYKRLEPDLTKYDTDIEIEQNIITKNLLQPSPFK